METKTDTNPRSESTNELGLIKKQALRLDLFKYMYPHIKSVQSTYSVVDEIIKYIKSN